MVKVGNPRKEEELFMTRIDFYATCFKDDWYIGYDKLGDGFPLD